MRWTATRTPTPSTPNHLPVFYTVRREIINFQTKSIPYSDEIDVLKLMNVSAKDQGVSVVEGPIPKYPAYKFRLPYGNVPLSNSTAVTQAMNNPNGFTVVFLYRQQKNNLGTLLSVHPPGRLTPWFQLTSNSKMGLLTLKYRVENSPKIRQIEWDLPRHHRKAPLAGELFWKTLGIYYIAGL